MLILTFHLHTLLYEENDSHRNSSSKEIFLPREWTSSKILSICSLPNAWTRSVSCEQWAKKSGEVPPTEGNKPSIMVLVCLRVHGGSSVAQFVPI